MKHLFRQEQGFTWIEWVIFVALLGGLLALSIPRIQLMIESFQESATKANIAAIKSAISIYYGDHEGVWPTVLDVNDKTPGFGFGNYLEAMPAVKATHPSDPAGSPAGNQVTYKSFTDGPSLAEPNSDGTGWRYDGPNQGNTGRIWVNSSRQDTKDVSYTTYGYQ